MAWPWRRTSLNRYWPPSVRFCNRGLAGFFLGGWSCCGLRPPSAEGLLWPTPLSLRSTPAHPPTFLETGGLPLYPRRGLRPCTLLGGWMGSLWRGRRYPVRLCGGRLGRFPEQGDSRCDCPRRGLRHLHPRYGGMRVLYWGTGVSLWPAPSIQRRVWLGLRRCAHRPTLQCLWRVLQGDSLYPRRGLRPCTLLGEREEAAGGVFSGDLARRDAS